MAADGDSHRVHRTRIERGSRTDSREGASDRVEGFCECGCGTQTRLAPQTARTKGWIKGKPLRFALGHANRTKQRPPLGEDDYTVEDRGYKTPCWIRRGHLNNKGYGIVVVAGRRMYAHRAMYEQEVGLIPEGYELDHLCRQTECMNHGHVEPVIRAINLQRGNGAKLTADEVREIRRAPSSVMTKTLAKRYGISESQMSRVRCGLRWRNIGD